MGKIQPRNQEKKREAKDLRRNLDKRGAHQDQDTKSKERYDLLDSFYNNN